ncbi:uncharacterized protein MONBRDRAFT_31036 [Monosiga brevicollis MX1]|uniref:Protein-serine/threonine kinase n=1 Tax=Monosiga brevicollis TaxID=81824 RepID=A9UQV4_MONBE|nr:uncharacterized protein MONBRDRAFT_31036 [Monosiga brevicollis MX1]EDQ93111.1 predicted protein [Monosiga brevicollis MX1]|eukprot:XP_001742873.1 hypothetical protein [Monosiga brevicollis MX1]
MAFRTAAALRLCRSRHLAVAVTSRTPLMVTLRSLSSVYSATKAITVPWSESAEEQLAAYSKYKINRLSLQALLDFGKRRDSSEALMQSCNFIHTECPIRLAHMIKEMRTLPDVVLSQPLINRVYNWYLLSFKELIDYMPVGADATPQDADAYCQGFTELLERTLLRHRATVITFALGLRQLHNKGLLVGREEYITEYLNRFLMARIGIRFVFNQHLALFSHRHQPRDPRDDTTEKVELGSRWIGSIDPAVRVDDIATDACLNAQQMCYDLYGDAPKFEIIQPREEHNDLSFAYVPSHLYHILFELLKNSMRATAEQHDNSPTLPPVRIIIVKGDSDLTVKISDEGGGIAHADVPKLFTYFYSTAPQPVMFDDEEGLTDMDRAPMAGFGYGLPVARLYSRYFGGDLNLMTVQVR